MKRRRFGSASPDAERSGPVALPEPGRGDVVVRTLRSGVSRGTETLVFRGGVPPRTPFQEAEFPGPVKYGYLNVGAVEEGPPELRGRTVFCLYPHQTAYVESPPPYGARLPEIKLRRIVSVPLTTRRHHPSRPSRW